LSFILMHKAMYDYTQGILEGLVAPEVIEAPREAGVPVLLSPRRIPVRAG
jgi:hypothetical protein